MPIMGSDPEERYPLPSLQGGTPETFWQGSLFRQATPEHLQNYALRGRSLAKGGAVPHSSLAERPSNLIAQRLEQVLQRRAFLGADESVDGHARHQLKIPERADLFGVQRCPHHVIRLVGLLFARQVG